MNPDEIQATNSQPVNNLDNISPETPEPEPSSAHQTETASVSAQPLTTPNPQSLETPQSQQVQQSSVTNEPTVQNIASPTSHFASDPSLAQTPNSTAQPNPVAIPEQQTTPTTSTTSSDLPPEIHGWNWGAFFLTWIWGIANKVNFAFLSLIPIVGFVIMVMLGLKGNELAWKNRKFENIEQFKAVQKKWAMWAWIALGIIVVLTIITTVFTYRKVTSQPDPGNITPIELQ